MKSRRVDHSSETLRITCPVYRVNFWKRPYPGYAYNLDAWILSDCENVEEVLVWARERARGRPFEILTPDGSGENSDGLIQLFGTDPNWEE